MRVETVPSTIATGLLVLTSTATAQKAASEDSDTGGGGELGNLLETINRFVDSWDQTLIEALTEFIKTPFKTVLELLLQLTVELLTATPTVHPNPAILEIHRLTLLLVYLVAGLIFTVTGILYIIGPVLGISYSQVRLILPKLILALILSTVSPQLLQLTIDFTDAVVHAFKPQLFGQNWLELIGLSSGLLLAVLLKAVLLIAVASIMIIRVIYIMFVTAISPLILITWSLPKINRYADTFISGYVAALIIAPLNLLVLRFSLALMKGQGTNIFQAAENWILGVASLILLVLLPYQVWGASQAIVGQARGLASKTVNRITNQKTEKNFDLDQDEQRRLESYRRRKEGRGR